jgi:hypothetical protein
MSTTEDAQRRLAEVDAAISRIMRTGQMVQTVNGKVQQANLAELRRERAALEQELANAQSSSNEMESFGSKVFFYGRS